MQPAPSPGRGEHPCQHQLCPPQPVPEGVMGSRMWAPGGALGWRSDAGKRTALEAGEGNGGGASLGAPSYEHQGRMVGQLVGPARSAQHPGPRSTTHLKTLTRATAPLHTPREHSHTELRAPGLPPGPGGGGSGLCRPPGQVAHRTPGARRAGGTGPPASAPSVRARQCPRPASRGPCLLRRAAPAAPPSPSQVPGQQPGLGPGDTAGLPPDLLPRPLSGRPSWL